MSKDLNLWVKEARRRQILNSAQVHDERSHKASTGRVVYTATDRVNEARKMWTVAAHEWFAGK